MILDNNKFTGSHFEVKNGIFYVDGHPIMDLHPNRHVIELSGSGKLISDKKVIIYGEFSGEINANVVIINGKSSGTITAQTTISNK